MKELIFILIVSYNLCYGEIKGMCEDKFTKETGKCVSIHECPAVLPALMKNQFPQPCGFEGIIPYVCCEEPSKINNFDLMHSTFTMKPTPVIGEISKQKCREYGTYVYELLHTPILGMEKTINVSVCGRSAIPLFVEDQRARPKEFPHQALLGFDVGNKKKWKCSGTLISDQFVLTSAHCTRIKTDPVKYIRLGELRYKYTNDDAKPEDFIVAEIIRHLEFKPPMAYNDIALLKLDRPVKFNRYIRPACLHTTFEVNPDEPESHVRYIASGWNNEGDLEKVYLNGLDVQKCNKSSHLVSRNLSKGILSELQFCVIANDDIESCQMDSGGPLQIFHKDVYCMNSIVGITSFGKQCSIIRYPGIYTRVSHYIDWIEMIVWPE